MVIASEPGWLHTTGQIAGTLLLLELTLALVIVCALMVVLALAAWWVHSHVIPVVGRYSAQAQHVMEIAERGSDRVVQGVAEFHGRRQGLETALRVFLFGPQAAKEARVENEIAVETIYDRGAIPPRGQNEVIGYAPGDLPHDPRRPAPMAHAASSADAHGHDGHNGHNGRLPDASLNGHAR